MVPSWPEIEETQPSSRRLQRKPIVQNAVEATPRGHVSSRERWASRPLRQAKERRLNRHQVSRRPRQPKASSNLTESGNTA
jgi:hypothetical protein